MFVNDPQMDDLPAVGDSEVAHVAYRTWAGRAVRWNPASDSIAALIEFTEADDLVEVGGAMFRKATDGTLVPAALEAGVIVRPPAGEWFRLDAKEFTQTFARFVPEVAAGADSADREDAAGHDPDEQSAPAEPSPKPAKKAPAKK